MFTSAQPHQHSSMGCISHFISAEADEPACPVWLNKACSIWLAACCMIAENHKVPTSPALQALGLQQSDCSVCCLVAIGPEFKSDSFDNLLRIQSPMELQFLLAARACKLHVAQSVQDCLHRSHILPCSGFQCGRGVDWCVQATGPVGMLQPRRITSSKSFWGSVKRTSAWACTTSGSQMQQTLIAALADLLVKRSPGCRAKLGSACWSAGRRSGIALGQHIRLAV